MSKQHKDELLFLSNLEDGLIGCFIDATDVIKESAEIHKTSPVVTVGLGRTLMGAMLIRGVDDIGTPLSITLSVNGNGPARGWYAVSDGNGIVRGFPKETYVNIPPKKDDGKLDVGTAIGLGYLTVKSQRPNELPNESSSELLSGEIADDLAYFYNANRQIPAACALGVTLNEDGSVKHAGGYLIKLLPGANPDVISKLEKNLILLKDVSDLLEHKSIEKIAKEALKGINYEVTDNLIPRYFCSCSKDRTIKILQNLDNNTLSEFLEDDDPVETVCQFCNTKYSFSNEDIEEIIKSKS